MHEQAWWLKLIVFLALATLGTLLYFSAAAFFNVWVVPRLKPVSPQHAHQVVSAVLVVISFVSALIGAFFSAFLYQMVGGGRPYSMALLFALPPVLVQLYALQGSRITSEMAWIYGVENIAILLAYLLLSMAGRRVWQRFFLPLGERQGG
jgi:hypothetical protein